MRSFPHGDVSMMEIKSPISQVLRGRYPVLLRKLFSNIMLFRLIKCDERLFKH